MIEHIQPKAIVILVCEHPAMLGGCRELLQWDVEKYDLQIYPVSTGRAALDTMETVTPDLIIAVSYMSREIGGKQFFETVRGRWAWRDIPFIILMAAGSPQTSLKGWKMGVDQYMLKPYDDDHFVKLVETTLDTYLPKRDSWREKIRKEKVDIARVLGGELRHPMTFISLMAQIIEMSFDSGDVIDKFQLDDVSESVDDMARFAQRLHRFVGNMVMAHHLRLGDLPPQFSATVTKIPNFSQLVRESWEAFTHNQMSYYAGCVNLDKIELTADIAPTLPAVYGAPSALQYAIIHLLENALKFVDKAISLPEPLQKDGHVTLRVYHDTPSNTVHITIHDDGLGFPPTIASELFQINYQWKRWQFEQFGFGLGLYLTQKIVTMHGGRTIGVSEGFKQGATFTITLPAYDETMDGTWPLNDHTTVHEAVILVVEDDVQIQELLVELLTMTHEAARQYQIDVHPERKYEVLTADNGVEALRLLKQKTVPVPDLILSDNAMPIMGGVEFVQHVKQNPDWSHIPVIFLTALPLEEINDPLTFVPDQIFKPFEPNELLQRIEMRLNENHIEPHRQSAYVQATGGIIASIENDFSPIVQAILDQTANINAALTQAQAIDDELQTQIEAYLTWIHENIERMNRLTRTYLETIKATA